MKLRIFLFLGLILLVGVKLSLAQTPINCGQVIIDSIGIAGEKDTYTFAGSANDKVTIRLGQLSGDLYF